MKRLHILFLNLLFICGTLLTACGQSSQEETNLDTAAKKPSAPVITDNGERLLFSWFEENNAKTAMKLDDIPDNVKKEVRVQDLKIPPEQRNPAWIFLADLTQKDSSGKYKVRIVARDKYEAKRHPAASSNAASDASNGRSQTAAASVIMYSTPYCPHCKKARRWLLEQKIPYKEIDINKDQAAAMQLAQKGQAQGVPTSGVPMFEINGRVIPGFDPAAIQKALTLPPVQANPSPPVPSRTNPPTAGPSPAMPPPSSITI